ncbi:MAG: serine/threonine protein kinase [Myxococcales bacterium]|nr:serine/threonine protein kinase [Myxococcales bacterium]
MQHTVPPSQKPQGSLLLEDPFLGLEIGALRILELIGEGGFGAVYKALDLESNTPLAIKILRINRNAHLKQTIHDRFQREADILQRLRHPNIVQSKDFGQLAEGVFYLVMEYLQGESLQQRLIEDQQIHPVALLRWLPQLGSALEYIHTREIIHRDLKPENLFLHKDPQTNTESIKLLDFGIASIAEESSITQTGKAFGSPLYMSPEQVKGEGKRATAQTDIYSLGIILHEALTGIPPFQGEGPAIMFAHLMTAPPRLSDVSPNVPWNPTLEGALLRALAKEPTERWPNIRSMIQAVVAGLQELLQTIAHQTSGSVGQITSPHRVISPFSPAPSLDESELSYEDDDDHQHTTAMKAPGFSRLELSTADPFAQDEATIARNSPRIVSFDQLPAASGRASSTQEEIEVSFIEQNELQDLDTSFDSLQLSNPIDPASGIELDSSFDSLQIHKMRVPLTSLPEVTGIRGVRPPLPPHLQQKPLGGPPSPPSLSSLPPRPSAPPPPPPPKDGPSLASVPSLSSEKDETILGEKDVLSSGGVAVVAPASEGKSSLVLPLLLLGAASLLLLLGAFLFWSSSQTTISSKTLPQKQPLPPVQKDVVPSKRVVIPAFPTVRVKKTVERELPIPLRDIPLQPRPNAPTQKTGPTNPRPSKIKKNTKRTFYRRKRWRRRKKKNRKLFEFEPKLSP